MGAKPASKTQVGVCVWVRRGRDLIYYRLNTLA